jgi:uncharacterized protein (TIGR00304 family)
VRAGAFVPLALLVAGAVLVGAAVAAGGASLAIVVVVPVVSGRSLEFVAGVLLLIAGLFTLPLALGPVEERDGSDLADDAGSASGGSGGVVLIGPVPIFFGRWKSVSFRTRLVAAVVGALVLVGAVAVFVLVRG